jgi:hypothetical protein
MIDYVTVLCHLALTVWPFRETLPELTIRQRPAAVPCTHDGRPNNNSNHRGDRCLLRPAGLDREEAEAAAVRIAG